VSYTFNIWHTHAFGAKTYPCTPNFDPCDLDLDFRLLPPGELRCLLAILVLGLLTKVNVKNMMIFLSAFRIHRKGSLLQNRM